MLRALPRFVRIAGAVPVQCHNRGTKQIVRPALAGMHVGFAQREENERGAPCAVAQVRALHVSPHSEVTPLLIGIGIAAAAYTASYGVRAWEKYQEQKKSQPAATAASKYARRFYDGGFESKMTRREAALILGVRYTRAWGYSTAAACALTPRACAGKAPARTASRRRIGSCSC